MDQRKREIIINGCIETKLTHDEWLNQFILWLESRGECFGGGTKYVSSRKKSIFTEEFQKIIIEIVEKGKYDPDTDPVLIKHKRKVQKIIRGW